MKMRPGTQTGFLLCGKEWIDGEPLEDRRVRCGGQLRVRRRRAQDNHETGAAER